MIEHELFAAAMTRLRGERSQSQVARAAGIHRGTWSDYEAGKRLPRETQRGQIFGAPSSGKAARRARSYRSTGASPERRFRSLGRRVSPGDATSLEP